MSHAINSRVLTGTNPCINKAIHVLLMHSFAVLQISIPGASQKLTSSSVTCTVAITLSFALEAAFSKRSQVRRFSVIIGTGKKKLFETISPNISSEKMFLCNNSDRTCFSDIVTSAGPLGRPLGRCWNPRLSGSGFNTSLGAQQMLMHHVWSLYSNFLTLVKLKD